MQHTENYNLSIIETSDPFSPDALNDNARALETQLERVDAALLAEQSARLSAAATETARVNAALAAKAPQTEIARVDAALAQRPRMVYGSYEGKGTFGSANRNKLDFADTLGCAPKLVIVADSASWYQLVMVNGASQAIANTMSTDEIFQCYLTWRETGVEWFTTYKNATGTACESQMSMERTYYYVAFA